MSLIRKQIQHPPPCHCEWWGQAQLQAFSSQLLVRQQFQRRLQEWVGGTCRKIALCDICRDPRALWVQPSNAAFNTRSPKDHCTRLCKAKRITVLIQFTVTAPAEFLRLQNGWNWPHCSMTLLESRWAVGAVPLSAGTGRVTLPNAVSQTHRNLADPLQFPPTRWADPHADLSQFVFFLAEMSSKRKLLSQGGNSARADHCINRTWPRVIYF